MKKVSFVNPNFQQGPKEFNAYYLPYSAAVLWSYAQQFPLVKDNYQLGKFIWRRDPFSEAIEKLKDSYIVGFSTYIWNKNYNNSLAKTLKEQFPDTIILFGGPEPPVEKKNFFKLFPYIDVCVKKEGEITFKKLLETPKEEWKSIPGLLINDNGKTIDTGEAERITELDHIPSPYLNGLFDDLLVEHPDITWNATLETNRGCPYACTFCDWGSLTYNKVKNFNLERVYAELEWIGKNSCDFVSITDANFGIFPERDSLIADKLIEVQQTYNNPKAYTISWAKNQKREIIEIVKKLIYKGGSKIGLNLSLQTLDENTLEIIKRKNLEMNRVEEVFELCEENNIPLFTELILGLPGQTIESWKENFYKLYKIGNHTGITVYQAQLLENAEMNLLQRKLYKLEGRVVYDYIVGTYSENEIREGVEVVISTKDMPVDVMVEAQLFSWVMNTFHINGLTNYISRFLYKFNNVEYKEFYDKLYSYIQNDPWLSNELNRIKHHYKNWTTDGKIDHTPIQGIEVHGWNLIHSTIINLHNEDKFDHVFNVIEKFVYENFKLPPDMFEQLMNFQRNYVIAHSKMNEYPKTIKCDFSFLDYIQNDKPLESPSEYHFDFPEDKDMSIREFCEQIYFARRRNFGKAWITISK
jgi:radical SAM superfamily enzyme YgiQ (UPF0313 family)